MNWTMINFSQRTTLYPSAR